MHCMGGCFARPTADHADKETDKRQLLHSDFHQRTPLKNRRAGDELKHKVALDTIRCGISPLAAESAEVGARFC
jgi:hypothetical protein